MMQRDSRKRRWIIVALIGVGLVLTVVGVIAGSAFLSQAGWLPRRVQVGPLAEQGIAGVTPPPSMAELAEDYPELAPILTDPELGTVYKEFLLAYEEGGLAAAASLAQKRGLLTPDGERLRITLILDTEEPEPLIAELQPLGVEVMSAFRDRVNIAVSLELLEGALASAESRQILQQLTELEHVIAVRLPEERDSHQQGQEGEGVRVIGARAWHEAGYTGEGVRIGVLDLGFAGYRTLLGQDLPSSVRLETFGWYDDEEAHGTACAEIVHEMAPGADLLLAWYDGSDAAMGEAVTWLVDQDVDIISHSAGSVLSPRDGTGWDAGLVDETVARGVLWVNSAGNEADVHFRGIFNDADGDGYHDFQPGVSTLPISVRTYVRIYLTWEESWASPTQDFELHVLDRDGDVIASSEDAQNGGLGQQPAEWVVLETNESVVYAAMYACDVDRAVTFDIFAIGPGAEIAGAVPEYSVNSPGDALGALTVGAVGWDDDRLAIYSSQGPTTDERLKPEISGPTGVTGITYGRRGFDGTSASAPHVAGAAALMWQAYPEMTREGITDHLLREAVDLGPAGPDTGYGHGRLRLPAPPEAGIVPLTPSPTTAMGSPTPAESASAPTPVLFVTPGPAARSSDGGGRSVLLLGLLVGGLGLGGTGLVVLGGALLILEIRSGKRPSPPTAPPQPPPATPSRTRSDGSPPHREQLELPKTVVYAPSGLRSATSGTDAPRIRFGERGSGQQRSPERDTKEQRGALICPQCGQRARLGARFCAACGTPLSAGSTVFCKACGAPMRPGDLFCGNCGHRE